MEVIYLFSHENLMDSDSETLGKSPLSNLSPISAEAPELSSPSLSEVRHTFLSMC